MPTSYTEPTKPTTSFTKEMKPTGQANPNATWDDMDMTWNDVTGTWDAPIPMLATTFTHEAKPTTSFTRESKP